jgi:hypothetical protein
MTYSFPMRELSTPVAKFIIQRRVEELGYLGVYNTRSTSALAEYFLDHYGTIMTDRLQRAG